MGIVDTYTTNPGMSYDHPLGYNSITLKCPKGYNTPFGYGIRVVGQHIGNFGEDERSQQQNKVSAFARVLWLSPGGIAESAGINVGDRVCISS